MTLRLLGRSFCEIFVLAALQTAAYSDEPHIPSMDEIRSEWGGRKHNVGEFKYQFKVVVSEFVPLRFIPSDDPLDEERDRLRGKVSERAVELVQQMTFKSAGDGWSVTLVGDALEHTTYTRQPFRMEHVSDGITNRLKREQTGQSYGIMAKRGALSWGGECPGLYEPMAVSLWCNPCGYFAQNFGDLATLEVESRDSDDIESECLELSMSRVPPSPRSKPFGSISLQVEREPPHFVRRVDGYVGRKLWWTTSLAYADDKSGDRIVTEWSHARYDERGNELHSELARLNRYEADCDFDSDEFTLTYPAGTMITEYTADRGERTIEWLQGANGQLQKVRDADDKFPK